METLQLITLIFLGLLVLITYYFYLIKDSDTGYIISWIQYPPKKGIMYGNNLVYTLILFLISATIWPIATYYKIHWLVILSLITTAIASILLLAGTIEEQKEDIKWYKVLGMLSLCLVTVLGDGVIWNANYIKKLS